MIIGILKQWKSGGYAVYSPSAQLNHYLTEESVIQVEVKGKWWPVTWERGPGGMHGVYDTDRSVPENVPTKLFEASDNVVQIRRQAADQS